MTVFTTLIYVAILIMSVVVHEVAHGYTAYYLGDSTAKHAGRLTINPIPHLDIFGSVILPFLFILLGGPIFGWAKPVPFNPNNLRNYKWGTVAVAFAGVFSNLVLAFIFAGILRLTPVLGIASDGLSTILGIIVATNVLLAIFNLVPLPPLDGSRILFALLPSRLRGVEMFIERYALIIFFVFAFVIWPYFAPIVNFVTKWLLGL